MPDDSQRIDLGGQEADVVNLTTTIPIGNDESYLIQNTSNKHDAFWVMELRAADVPEKNTRKRHRLGPGQWTPELVGASTINFYAWSHHPLTLVASRST